MPQVRARTLLLAGKEDNMTPFSPSDSGVGFVHMQRMFVDSEMEVLPDCGHYLVIEQPLRATARIVEFLRR